MTMVVLQKWNITITFENGRINEFYIADNYYSNVLRRVADLGYRDEVVSISVVRDNAKPS